MVCVFSVKIKPGYFELVLSDISTLEFREKKCIFFIIGSQYEEQSLIPFRKMLCEIPDKRGRQGGCLYKKYLELAVIVKNGVDLFDLFLFFFSEIELG